MKYSRFKVPGACCPKCSRKLDMLFPGSSVTNAESFYICFKCKTIGQINQGLLKVVTSLKEFETSERKAEIKATIAAMPDNYRYKAQGSQLRYEEKTATYKRQWLSLNAYEKVFGEAAPLGNSDFRDNQQSCKWCNTQLIAPRRSFCSDRCSRAYGKATFFNRTLATLPYRIACRDRFYCQVTGEDLAVTNKFGVRIPASNGQLEVHHLVRVADGGSDHQQNLLTISRDVHRDYHKGEPFAVKAIDQIKAQRLVDYAQLMIAAN